jgi:hypothetical protein
VDATRAHVDANQKHDRESKHSEGREEQRSRGGFQGGFESEYSGGCAGKSNQERRTFGAGTVDGRWKGAGAGAHLYIRGLHRLEGRVEHAGVDELLDASQDGAVLGRGALLSRLAEHARAQELLLVVGHELERADGQVHRDLEASQHAVR